MAKQSCAEKQLKANKEKIRSFELAEWTYRNVKHGGRHYEMNVRIGGEKYADDIANNALATTIRLAKAAGIDFNPDSA